MMHRTNLALTLLALACSVPTENDSAGLLGHWVTQPENLSPSGWYQSHLKFGRSGMLVFEVRSYGLLPGQGREELSAYSKTQGRYRTEGDRFFFEPRRLVWWDRFYGADSPEHVEAPYPYGTLFDDAHLVLRGDELTISYLSYPFDAPVQTVMVLTRMTE